MCPSRRPGEHAGGAGDEKSGIGRRKRAQGEQDGEPRGVFHGRSLGPSEPWARGCLRRSQAR